MNPQNNLLPDNWQQIGSNQVIQSPFKTRRSPADWLYRLKFKRNQEWKNKTKNQSPSWISLQNQINRKNEKWIKKISHSNIYRQTAAEVQHCPIRA